MPFFEGRACASAEAATDFVLADERPSRSAADALRATDRDVCFEFLAILIHLLLRHVSVLDVQKHEPWSRIEPSHLADSGSCSEPDSTVGKRSAFTEDETR